MNGKYSTKYCPGVPASTIACANSLTNTIAGSKGLGFGERPYKMERSEDVVARWTCLT